MNDPILVKLSNSYGYCAVSTYTRRDRGHGRFLISKEILEKVMESGGGHLFHDTDCANIVQLWRDKDTVVMMLFWLSVCSDGKINGLRQRITVPIDKLKHVLEDKESVRMLYRMPTGGATIDHRPAAEVIRRICQDKQIRRAFSKAMRDQFHWQGDHVTLIRDGEFDFFFRTKSGFPACGGLILHESLYHGQTRYLYAIHT